MLEITLTDKLKSERVLKDLLILNSLPFKRENLISSNIWLTQNKSSNERHLDNDFNLGVTHHHGMTVQSVTPESTEELLLFN